ncbi:hypothetical protein G6F23_016091 [Rhizopus arrhizus]|nr:hypothetical protein G6F23_016091 [Rhizopus arrhizus]
MVGGPPDGQPCLVRRHAGRAGAAGHAGCRAARASGHLGRRRGRSGGLPGRAVRGRWRRAAGAAPESGSAHG